MRAEKKKREKEVRMFEWITVCAHASFFHIITAESLCVCARALFCFGGPVGHTETQGTQTQFVVVSSVSFFCVVVSRFRLFTHSPSRLLGNWGCTSVVGEEMGSAAGSFVIFFFPSSSWERRRRDIALWWAEKNVCGRSLWASQSWGLVWGPSYVFSLESAL